MTRAADAILIDTSVLVAAASASSPRHRLARKRLDDLRTFGHEMWVTRQILREYIEALTPTMPVPMLAHHIAAFESDFRVADETHESTQQLLDLLSHHHGASVRAANLVAAMQLNSVAVLLTDSPADYQRFHLLITIEALQEGRKLP